MAVTRSTILLKFFRREDVPESAINRTPIAEIAQSLSWPASEWWEKSKRFSRDGFLYKVDLAGLMVEGDIAALLRKALDTQPEIDHKLGFHDVELKVVLFTGRREHPGVTLENRTLQLLVQLGASFDVDIY